jgi:replicative DNA helicase
VTPVDPNSPETWLVAGALTKPALIPEAAPLVTGKEFTNKALGHIWDVMVKMISEGATEKDMDIPVIAKRVTPSPGTQRNIGLMLAEVIEHFPKMTSLTATAKRIRQRYILKSTWDDMKTLGGEIMLQLRSSDGKVDDLEERLAALSIKVASLSDETTNRTTYKDRAKEVGAYFDSIASGPVGDSVPTGIVKLDKKLGGGLRPGQLHSILGGTGSGKTALASQICDEAVKRGYGAIMFSMEVDPVDIWIRDVERRSGRSRWDLRSQSEEVRTKAQDALVAAQAAILNQSEGKVVYGEPMSVEGIRQTILTEQLRTGNIKVVAVDHAQVALPSREDQQRMPRYLEVKGTAEGLREVARHLNVAVVLTAQLNPPPIGKGGKKQAPAMEQVRESKDINNCSEVVMVIHHEKEEVAEEVVIMESWIRIEKARAGSAGKVPVTYRGSVFRFEDIYKEQE